MDSNSHVVHEIKPGQVPILQRCLRCMSKGDFSLKQAYSICFDEPGKSKFYCGSCLGHLKGQGNTKVAGLISAKKIGVEISSLDIRSNAMLHGIQYRRDRIVEIVEKRQGKTVVEITEIYNSLYLPEVKPCTVRSDLIFLVKETFIEKRYDYSGQRYYPLEGEEDAA